MATKKKAPVPSKARSAQQSAKAPVAAPAAKEETLFYETRIYWSRKGNKEAILRHHQVNAMPLRLFPTEKAMREEERRALTESFGSDYEKYIAKPFGARKEKGK